MSKWASALSLEDSKLNDTTPPSHQDTSTKGNPFAYPIALIWSATLLLICLSCYMFLDHLFGIQHGVTIVELFDLGPKHPNWPILYTELNLFTQNGYYLDWLNWWILKYMRTHIFPYSQFLDLLLLRVYGVMMVLVPTLILGATTFSCGRINFHRRRELFLNISSTKVHIMSQFRYVAYAIVCMYLFFPFGSMIPLIDVTIPIFIQLSLFGSTFTIWFSNPTHLFFFLAPFVSWICYHVGSHITWDI